MTQFFSYETITSNLEASLVEFRKSIDEIDDNLYNLFIKRINISNRVSVVKRFQSGSRSFFRQAREVEVILNAHRSLKNHYSKEFCVHIWRMFISALLNNEREFTIVSENTHCYWLAREYYGSFIQNTILNSANKVITSLSYDNTGCLAVPNYQNTDKWWVELVKSEYKIFAIYPFIKEDINPPVFFVANVDLEETGYDSSVLVLDTTLDNSEIIKLSKKLNIRISVIDEYLSYKLIVINNFVKNIEEISQEFKNGKVYMIGSFANPI